MPRRAKELGWSARPYTLGSLYQSISGESLEGAHDALVDTEALARVWRLYRAPQLHVEREKFYLHAIVSVKTLKALDKLARSPDGYDDTKYGEARHYPRSFFQYHASALSLAVQLADARSIRNRVASLSFFAGHAPPGSLVS